MAYFEPGHNRKQKGGEEVKKKGEERGREKTTECKREREREEGARLSGRAGEVNETQTVRQTEMQSNICYTTLTTLKQNSTTFSFLHIPNQPPVNL